jgi:site-specific DNA-methyltransferase (adenine-specific)
MTAPGNNPSPLAILNVVDRGFVRAKLVGVRTFPSLLEGTCNAKAPHRHGAPFAHNLWDWLHRLSGILVWDNHQIGDLNGAMTTPAKGAPRESARLVFSDPPYNLGVDYGAHYNVSQPAEDYLDWCNSWLSLCGSLLTWDGSLLLLINWEWLYDLAILGRELGLHIRQQLTWYESFGVNCERKYSRCSRPIVWFTRHRASFAWNPEAVNRPSDRQAIYHDKRGNPDGKNCGDVLGINPPIPRLTGTCKERLPDFPTQLPLGLLRPLVGAHSNPGDLVIDPFSGSGTTGAACFELDRKFLGVELGQEFVDLSRKRLTSLELKK